MYVGYGWLCPSCLWLCTLKTWMRDIMGVMIKVHSSLTWKEKLGSPNLLLLTRSTPTHRTLFLACSFSNEFPRLYFEGQERWWRVASRTNEREKTWVNMGGEQLSLVQWPHLSWLRRSAVKSSHRHLNSTALTLLHKERLGRGWETTFLCQMRHCEWAMCGYGQS